MSHRFQRAGRYEVKAEVRDADGHQIQSNATVTGPTKPYFVEVYDPLDVACCRVRDHDAPGDAVEIDDFALIEFDIVGGRAPFSYEMQFGDGERRSGQVVERSGSVGHAYAAAGDFDITVEVTDADGNEVTSGPYRTTVSGPDDDLGPDAGGPDGSTLDTDEPDDGGPDAGPDTIEYGVPTAAVCIERFEATIGATQVFNHFQGETAVPFSASCVYNFEGDPARTSSLVIYYTPEGQGGEPRGACDRAAEGPVIREGNGNRSSTERTVTVRYVGSGGPVDADTVFANLLANAVSQGVGSACE
jgi:hypothetical protein